MPNKHHAIEQPIMKFSTSVLRFLHHSSLPPSLHIRTILSGLDESNIRGLFSEALTADVESVFSDETGLMGADSASARAFSVATGAGEPDSFVGHVELLTRV